MKENQCPGCHQLAKGRVYKGNGDYLCPNPLCDVRTFRPRTRLVEALTTVGQSIDPANRAATVRERAITQEAA
jgi:hypothetical protein